MVNFKNLTFKARCIICNSPLNTSNSIASLSNSYSELFAEYFSVSESIIIESSYNLQCSHCNFIQKAWNLQDNDYSFLYNLSLPTHPKGSDIGKSISSGMIDNAFSSYLDHKTLPRLQRELIGIFSGSQALKSVQQIILKSDSFQDLTLFKDHFSTLLDQFPYDYNLSRFKGNDFKPIVDLIFALQNNYSAYIEFGCPKWGLLSYAFDIPMFFNNLSRGTVFWGLKCLPAKDNFCVSDLPVSTISNFIDNSIYGIYQMLDHYTNPLFLLSNIFSLSSFAIIIILESTNDFIPVQHPCVINTSFLSYLSDLYSFSLQEISLGLDVKKDAWLLVR